MKEKKQVGISVIMPVYKVEKYVAKAIESILNQSFQSFEFIIVDDGTPDKSGEICEAYAQKDNRIKVIHQKNSGAPAARNKAMEQACGKYYYFMDSDDWAEPQMLQDMYEEAERTNAQLVITGFYIDTYYGENEKFTQLQTECEMEFKTQKDFREKAHLLFDKNLLYSPWNKLYSAKYMIENKLKFPNTWMDDFPFVLSFIRDVERVAFIPKAYYHFVRARAESETARYKKELYEKREEEHIWMKNLYKYWNLGDEVNTAALEMIFRRYIERIVGCIENVTNPCSELTKKEQKNEIKRIINNPEVRRALKIAKPKSKYMKLMLVPVKWKNVSLCQAEGKFISKFKTKHIKTFAKLKANR